MKKSFLEMIKSMVSENKKEIASFVLKDLNKFLKNKSRKIKTAKATKGS